MLIAEILFLLSGVSTIPPVAVPEILCLLFAAQNFDRSHSLRSLYPPPASIGIIAQQDRKVNQS